MVGCPGQSRSARDANLIARGVVAVALADRAVIHAVDPADQDGPLRPVR